MRIPRKCLKPDFKQRKRIENELHNANDVDSLRKSEIQKRMFECWCNVFGVNKSICLRYLKIPGCTKLFEYVQRKNVKITKKC